MGLESGQYLFLPFEFLQQIRLEIGTADDFEHFENRRQRDMMLQCMRLMQKKLVSFIQVFQPQHGTDAFVERVFVNNQCKPLSMSGYHLSEILNGLFKKYKPVPSMMPDFQPVFYIWHAIP